MPLIETPPEEQTPPISPPPVASGGRGARLRYLDTHELITLIEDIDDERSRARFRESMYLAIILWLSLLLVYIFLPRWLPHRPVLVTQERNPKELTYLDVPPDLKKLLRDRPAPHVSTQSTEAQTPKPSKVQRAPEPRAGTPQPRTQVQPAPRPQAQPLPSAPQPQAAQPQTQPAAPKAPQSRTPTPPLVDSPAPLSQKQPTFQSGGSAGTQIADAARGARSGGSQESGDYGSTGRGNAGQGKQGVEVLSDTQGVDFSRYLQRLLADVRRHWLPLIPEECNSPLFKQGITGVRFTILPDGTIAPPMHLDYSTHDVAIDRAAWGSIRSMGQAPPLPKEFRGPNLELRIEFRVNKDRDVQ